MADGNKAGDPKSSSDGSSHDGAGGGGSGGTNPPDLGNADRVGSMESDIGENPRQADRYMSIGNGGSRGGKSHGLPNFHGSSGSGYPHGSCNRYTNLHGSGGGGGGGSGSSGYPHGLGNGLEGSRHPHGFVNGYANLQWSGGGGSGSTVPFTPHYGGPDRTQPSGGGSGGVYQRNLSNRYGGARVLPQQAPMNNSYAAVPRFLPNGNGVGSRPPQRPGPQEYALISDRLASLAIGDGYVVGHRNTVAEFRNQQRPANGRGNPYWRMSLEDVKGGVISVARDLHGCQFLCRMLKERREDAVRGLFDEFAGDIVKLMGHDVAAKFVDEMSRLWTDEQVTSVIQTLGTSFPWEVMAAARNQSGSNVLQTLISRIEGRRQEIECFVCALARVGEANLLALIKDHAGSRVIQKCLETFSAVHNLFIVGVVMRNPYDVAYSKHGCHTMKRCIDKSIDVHTRDFLVYAVCVEGLGLAQNQFGNYVVQHVIRAVPGVPWAMEMLHADFRRMYVSLSRQKASSNVVQVCLAFFPKALSAQIVWELLSDQRFPELIEDPFANYVLQSAVSTTKGPLLGLLVDAIRPYRNMFRDSMHARKLFQMLFPSKRQQFF